MFGREFAIYSIEYPNFSREYDILEKLGNAFFIFFLKKSENFEKLNFYAPCMSKLPTLFPSRGGDFFGAHAKKEIELTLKCLSCKAFFCESMQ